MKRLILKTLILSTLIIAFSNFDCLFDAERDHLYDVNGGGILGILAYMYPPTPIYMFTTNTPTGVQTYDGDLAEFDGIKIDGRRGADNICKETISRPIYSNPGQYHIPGRRYVRAFISMSFDDSITYMPNWFGVPNDREILGPERAKIADNWDDLLDGNIDLTLESAQVFQGAGSWWSGSNWDGIYSGNSCSGWTGITGNGQNGISNSSLNAWLDDTTAQPCSESHYVVCISWN